jgi:hypothetical protein
MPALLQNNASLREVTAALLELDESTLRTKKRGLREREKKISLLARLRKNFAGGFRREK